MVADALSQKGPRKLFSSRQISDKLAEEMTRAGIELVVGQLANITLQSTLLERIKEAQGNDSELRGYRENVLVGAAKDFSISKMGLLKYKGQICVPMDSDIWREILDELHTTHYSLHPGTTKMYQDLRALYWWSGMKRDVVDYVAKCLTCQQVKAEHQRPTGFLQPLGIPE